MLAARLYGPKDLRLEEIPLPQISHGELLIKVKKAAVCGTDVRMYQNGAACATPQSPLIIGHEFSGDIAQVGSGVSGWQEGQRVFLAPNIGCGHCDACVSGNSHLCDNIMAIGVTVDGAFAEYIKIPAQALTHGNVSELGKNVSYEEAAVNEALSCVYNGFTHYRVNPGDFVLVIGAGPIGVLHAMLAKMAGAAKVMLSDLSPARLERCRAIDEDFIPLPSEGLKDSVYALTGGRGLDVCVTACPSPAVQQTSLELMGFGGRVNFFGGLPKNAEIVPLNTNMIHYKQLNVSGATKANTAMVRKTLSFIDSGKLDVKRLITGHYPLTRIEDALSGVAAGEGLKTIIDF